MNNRAVTVLGEIDPEELGITLTHEHLFIDRSRIWQKPKDLSKMHLAEAKIDITNRGIIRWDPLVSKENLVISDTELLVSEVMYFKMSGGRTICDVSPGTETLEGMSAGDPLGLRAVSAATDVNIIAGCGYYMHAAHPTYVAESTIDKLADRIMRDLTEGIRGTGIRAGIIGEIGVSSKMHPDEEKVLRAAAIAQQKTGAAITIHQSWALSKSGLEAVDILLEEGVKPERIILGHCDGTRPDVDYASEVADRGVYVEYDTFGFDLYIPQWGLEWGKDKDRIRCVAELIDRGYVKQILLSHDICMKLQLRRYGGEGFAHILNNVVLRMRGEENLGVGEVRHAISESDIQVMLIENPKRVLPWQ